MVKTPFFLISLVITIAIFLQSCEQSGSEKIIQQHHLNFIQFVNPFIGTKNMGHTFPGATAPFGMVQLSPETSQQPMYIDGKYNTETYRYCSGYQYDDTLIFGFAHTHFSGTGHADLGDFLIMPTNGELFLTPIDSTGQNKDYSSGIDKSSEYAEPGYYNVNLNDHNIQAELTATERVGFHQYTFSEPGQANIVLDMISNIYNHDDKNVWTFIRVENDTLVTGWRQTHGWARTRTVYFTMTFSEPIASYGHKKYDLTRYNGFYRKFNEEQNFPEMAGRNIRAWFSFDGLKDQQLKIKFALSPVSTYGALLNLQTEVPTWDFEQVKDETQAKWNDELSKIIVETQTEDQKETFYTALYHTMLSPIIYEDVDGSYRGLDQNIHQSDGFTNYTIFSLWDTYRALHPLFNLIQPKRNVDMVYSMLAHYDQSVHKMLPIWSHYANENWCMIGYHSTAVIADALVKNIGEFDIDRLLEASINTSTTSYYDGVGDYMKLGYVPEDKSSSSVSKTLEYAYNDWCIAQIAELAGNEEVAKKYTQRSYNYQHVYDPGIGFMRPKLSDGNWKSPFDPMDTHGQGFIEGNAWNYGLYVPHQIDDMIEMMGGKKRFSEHLDSLFTIEIDDHYIEKNEDITRDGIIGNYVHGNEPGHHIPYLYNWTNQPWKTQERVRMIMETMYSNDFDGLCGNDDAGQMSAWYIFSALGFYPVCPGSDEYAIGSPLVNEAVICFENGKKLVIKTANQGKENIYVERVTLNGKEVQDHILLHSEIIRGGEIIFTLSDEHINN